MWVPTGTLRILGGTEIDVRRVEAFPVQVLDASKDPVHALTLPSWRAHVSPSRSMVPARDPRALRLAGAGFCQTR